MIIVGRAIGSGSGNGDGEGDAEEIRGVKPLGSRTAWLLGKLHGA